MGSSVLVLVVIVASGVGLAAWARTHRKALGRPVTVGLWLSVLVPLITVAAYVTGMLIADHAVSSAAPEERQQLLGQGVDLMLGALLAGALGMMLLAAYLIVVLKTRH